MGVVIDVPTNTPIPVHIGRMGRGPDYRDLERVPKYTQRVVAIL